MKDASELRPKDRRLKTRHRAHGLQVTLTPKGFFHFFRLFRQPVQVNCIDINRYGMAIETPVKLRPKDRVLLDFKGRYISESDIEGIVTSVRALDGGSYRYGISFAYCTISKMYSRQIDNALSRIETLCSQWQSGSGPASLP